MAGSSYNKGIFVRGAEANFSGEYLSVEIDKPDCTDSVVGIQVYDSDAEFSAQTVDIDVTAKGSTSKWGFGLYVNGTTGGKATFTGGDVSIRTANSDYTAQALTVMEQSTIEFHNTGDIHISAESAFGVTAVDAQGTLVFDNAGDVLIEGALVPGTQTGQTNVVGIQGTSADWTVTERVNDFIIDMEGLGVDNDGTSYSTGTRGADLDGVTFNVASRTFTILMNTDADVEVTPPEDHTASKSYGLFLSEDSEQASVFTTSANTKSTIDVKNAVGTAYGIYVGMDSTRPDQAVTATFGGDTSIRAVGIDEASSIAILVEEAGIVNFNGGQNSIEGLVHVLTDSQLNFAGGTTMISGDVVLDGTSTLALSDAAVRLEGTLDSSSGESATGGKLAMTGSTLTITDNVVVDQLTAEESRLVYDSTTASFTAASANLTGESALTVAASGRLNDASGDASELIRTIAENTVLSGSNAEKVVLEEGLIRGEVVGTVDQEGKVTITKDAGASTSVNSLADAMSANLLIWRNDMHSITKRIDDVRNGAGTGAWVRLEGGSLSLDGASFDDFVTLSTGLDVQLPTDANLRAGAAFGYTDGDLSIEAGDGTSKIYEFTLYGAWTGESGLFADASATYARLSNEFNTGGLSADYDADAFAVGARVGMHFELPANFFVEPAIEASYGRVSAESFHAADGVEGEQSSMDSFVGTTGVRFGWTAPEDRGSLYANLSVSHDFLGETDVSMTNSAQTVMVSKDYGDTWVTFGLGGRLALTERTSIAAEVERTAGGDVDLDWRALVNLRYSW